MTDIVDDAEVMRIWRECGLPEYFLGNGGTNHKLVAFAERFRTLPAPSLDGEGSMALEAAREIKADWDARSRWITGAGTVTLVEPREVHVARALLAGGGGRTGWARDAEIERLREAYTDSSNLTFKLAADEIERLRAAATKIVNFAWSGVRTDNPEATEYLNSLLVNLRTALGEAKDE